MSSTTESTPLFPEPTVEGSATCSAIHESIERLLTLAGIATEPGWDIWDADLPHKLDLARETFQAVYEHGQELERWKQCAKELNDVLRAWRYSADRAVTMPSMEKTNAAIENFTQLWTS